MAHYHASSPSLQMATHNSLWGLQLPIPFKYHLPAVKVIIVPNYHEIHIIIQFKLHYQLHVQKIAMHKLLTHKSTATLYLSKNSVNVYIPKVC